MIQITPKATRAINDYCRDKEKMPIRIYLQMGGCGIRSFGLTIEPARPSDDKFEIDGHTFIVEHTLLQQFGPIKINNDGFSFLINGGGIYPPIGCGTCAFGCRPRRETHCTGNCTSCQTPCPTGQHIKSKRNVGN